MSTVDVLLCFRARVEQSVQKQQLASLRKFGLRLADLSSGELLTSGLGLEKNGLARPVRK